MSPNVTRKDLSRALDEAVGRGDGSERAADPEEVTDEAVLATLKSPSPEKVRQVAEELVTFEKKKRGEVA